MAVTTDDLRDRTETDLPEETLQRILDAAEKSVERSAGSATSEAETHLAAGASFLALSRRHTAIVSIVERRRHSSDPVTLSANDYRDVGDYRLMRLNTGDNAASFWGAEAVVTYVPEVDADVRDRVTLDLAMLDIEFRAYEREKAGDWEGEQKEWKARRRELLTHIREGRALLL